LSGPNSFQNEFAIWHNIGASRRPPPRATGRRRSARRRIFRYVELLGIEDQEVPKVATVGERFPGAIRFRRA
jgi:hypothetical protein